LVQHPLKFRLFLLSKLPSAYFSGVRVQYVDEEKSVVTVPYKWFSTNPFRSTYFACLSMAAEMSTGVLAMTHTWERDPAISMLVLKVDGDFRKKATGVTTFTCEDGHRILSMINEAASTGKGTSIIVRSVGKNKDGDTVAEFAITWGFKVRS
jgi:hypothetical protein